ncbi:YheC/YheD family protein [Paenibacillus flagellatus]|uniref:ATP-binding protein n=1 Tax=Paenibacillus flagellatus TaxID=2211139 RepID=A0A2V5KBY3_9BACL|nr:YheC/YheD family protein [Paenibacillus flagellatus]PYI57089.1 ATP-binding protein [Paenibacillus flagellatus]
MAQPTLGIMTLYLSEHSGVEERSYFRKVIAQAEKLGLRAVVFTPVDVDAKNKRIHAYVYDTETGRWSRSWTPFPHLIYDRCRYQDSERFRKFRRFRATYTRLVYLNRPISNKWGMHQFLATSARIRPHLPHTRVYSEHADLTAFMRGRRLVYLKPINGTGGRGILRIERQSGGHYLVQGRDRNRRIVAPKLVSAKQLPLQLAAWNVKDRYLIQQGIPSKLPDGRVHDFRLLIQKNGSGEWEVTGCAGRVGPKMSITSNLHGGGQAVPMTELLRRRFASEEKIEEIRKAVYSLGYAVATEVEGRFGRLCELGIDIAIDPDGHPWLLELNPKPAREVFARIGEKETYEKAISRPLEYALWLYKQHYGTSSSRRRSGAGKSAASSTR